MKTLAIFSRKQTFTQIFVVAVVSYADLTVKKPPLRIYINQGPVVVVPEGLQCHVAACRENM